MCWKYCALKHRRRTFNSYLIEKHHCFLCTANSLSSQLQWLSISKYLYYDWFTAAIDTRKTNSLTNLSFFWIDADAAVVLDEATSTYQLEQYTKEELYNTHPHDVSAKWQFDKKQEVNSKNWWWHHLQRRHSWRLIAPLHLNFSR